MKKPGAQKAPGFLLSVSARLTTGPTMRSGVHRFLRTIVLQALVANLLLSVSQTTADIKIVRQTLQNCRERTDSLALLFGR